jgi:poly-gamma-glutamate capsule biosynthesis protein CapA/YwtB (metallophosphatase superfamily)
VNAIGLQRWRGKAGTLRASIRGIAKNAAMTGRANAVKRGSKLLRAILVNGRESENAKTPIKAKRRPLRWVLLREVAI